MYLAYSLLFALGALVFTPYYAWRYRKTSFLRKSWRERLGYLPSSIRPERSGAIWVHAVSVGETLAVAGLVEALAARYPGRPIFMSHITPTGREAGEKRLPKIAGRFFLPLDLRGALNRVVRRLRPALLLIVETELWPNLLRAAHESGAQVVLINARISDRSVKGYRFFHFLMHRVLDNVDWIMAQTPGDAKRFSQIGARPERVLMMGNLKFDGQPPTSRELNTTLKRAFAAAHRSPVLVAASTMPGEEEQVLRAWRAVQRHHPRSILILAPRHPARFDQVARILTTEGQEFVRRSALSIEASDLPEISRQLRLPEVLLLDSVGELAGIFDLADLVFMGGSLVPTGGHNLLEPAWWGKPIIFGPHMENFRDAVRIFLDAHAAVQVRSVHDLAPEILKLLGDDERRRAIGEAARNVVRQESGATERILNHLSTVLDEATPQAERPSG